MDPSALVCELSNIAQFCRILNIVHTGNLSTRCENFDVEASEISQRTTYHIGSTKSYDFERCESFRDSVN